MITSRGDILAYMQAAANITEADLGLVARLHNRVERLIKQELGYNVEQAQYTEYYPETNYQAPQDILITGYESIGNRATPIYRLDDSRRILQLRQLPVRSIISVYEDYGAWQTFPPTFTTQLHEGPDFYLDRAGEYASSYPVPGQPQGVVSFTGFLVRWSGVWAPYDRSVRVIYIGGLTPNELQTDFCEFQDAVLDALLWSFNQVKAQRPSIVGVSSPGATVSESLDGMTTAYEPKTQGYNLGLINKLPASTLKIIEPFRRMTQFI